MSGTKSIADLQENVSQFFTKVSSQNPELFQCKKGCSQCCYVELSAFSCEIQRIIDWYSGLPKGQQTKLVELWKTQQVQSLAFGKTKTPCSFLYDGSCSIYPARPIICRSQGLGLVLEQAQKVDHCPLNYTDKTPDKTDALNLERLNTLVSLAQMSYEDQAGNLPKQLKVEDQRVALIDLKSYFIDLKQ